jgi:squalene-hopene/tetraprenyl-beta-curcumene cyclase
MERSQTMLTADQELAHHPLPGETGSEPLSEAIRQAQDFLLRRQQPGGYWLGKLEADASVAAGYLVVMHFMGVDVDPRRKGKVVAGVLRAQNPDGSWSAYAGGPGDLNVSLQVVFGLRLGGLAADTAEMQRARDFILAAGGIRQASVFTKIWLALFGQFDWRGTPSIPPEIIFLPGWFSFNIYEFASWSRATIMALAVVLTCKPVCPLPPGVSLTDLYLEPPGERVYPPGKAQRFWSWKNFFLGLDAAFKLWEKLPFQPGRKKALQRVAAWILDHQEADGGWGGIMLPWIYSLFALKSLGYPGDHPAIRRGLQGMEAFLIEDETTVLLQPAMSPVWDTAWALLALQGSGLPGEHPALQQAASWLVGQEIRHAGDWQIKNPHTPPGGWAFEFVNAWYPDLDDSAVVPRALLGVPLPEPAQAGKAQAIQRARAWVLDMQSRDGGWAAFDRDNNKQFLNHVPFADFMSPLDPTCADVTAHVLEFLAAAADHPQRAQSERAVPRAIAYLKAAQESDGAWYGRWGVNYLYGTSQALAGLIAAGEDPGQAYIRRAVGWLMARQNPDGGWGETCETYADPAQRGAGPSTAAQTAWVLIGLIAAGEAGSAAVRQGIAYLLRAQQADGAWREAAFTGTGFPRVFYLHYELYAAYFPLIALARYQVAER